MQEGESVPGVKRVCLLDADSIIYICTHNKKGEPEKTLEEVKNKLDAYVQDIFLKTESTHYLIFLTLTTSFRKNYYTEYKSNRKGREKPKYFTEITNYLLDKYKAVWYNELEADDLCLITRNYFDKDGGDPEKALPSFISSPDKDMLMLPGTHYNYKKDEWVETSEEEAYKFFWTSMLTGDSSDGIKGIPKMGPVGAQKILEGLSEQEYPTGVFDTYLSYMQIEQGIEAFYNNYKALKILDYHPDYEAVIPEPIEIVLETKIED